MRGYVGYLNTDPNFLAAGCQLSTFLPAHLPAHLPAVTAGIRQPITQAVFYV
jgi:hypothetical protein